jgi:hypothetical protein
MAHYLTMQHRKLMMMHHCCHHSVVVATFAQSSICFWSSWLEMARAGTQQGRKRALVYIRTNTKTNEDKSGVARQARACKGTQQIYNEHVATR